MFQRFLTWNWGQYPPLHFVLNIAPQPSICLEIGNSESSHIIFDQKNAHRKWIFQIVVDTFGKTTFKALTTYV
jgi:hypothetical protein